ncbi:MAG: hypothetical protein U5P41_01900 [Gammaproteobacteria bacterium]|nr:hypothetical protein [Gammaproteobacteria bacterium]
MTEQWDDDIAALDLTDIEKNGLQMFRNYSGAFDKHQQKLLVVELNRTKWDISPLSEVITLLVNEEPRTLPIISCAFADDQLKAMYQREISEGVPGGHSFIV